MWVVVAVVNGGVVGGGGGGVQVGASGVTPWQPAGLSAAGCWWC